MVADWTDFFEGQVTASAALTGLVFVAISINLERIIGFTGLVGRAAEALLSLIAPVFTGLAVLVAGQTLRVIGFEVLGVVAIIASMAVRILATSGWAAARERPRSEYLTRCGMVGAAFVPGLVAAIMLISASADGFYPLAISTALCLVAGLIDAWVLLVEIVR